MLPPEIPHIKPEARERPMGILVGARSKVAVDVG